MVFSIIDPHLRREMEKGGKEDFMLEVAHVLREALKELPVALYGSGAQSLLELAYGKTLKILPNDLDIATRNYADLEKLFARMKKDPQHFEINSRGIYKKFPQQDTQVFEGVLIVGRKRIPFECYANTRIISQESWGRLRQALGVPVFHPEDISATYAHVLAIESEARRYAEEVAKEIYTKLITTKAELNEKYLHEDLKKYLHKDLKKYFSKPEEREEAVRILISQRNYEDFRRSEAFSRWVTLLTDYKHTEQGKREQAIQRLQ
jgi:hypothetical protein